MLLVEPKTSLGFDAERSDPGLCAGGHQFPPDVLGQVAGHVDLISQFAHESDPQNDRRHAGDGQLRCGKIRHRLGRQVTVTHCRQHLPAHRPRQVHRRRRSTDIRQPNVPIGPGGQPPAKPAIDPIGVAGGGCQKPAVVFQASDRTVIKNDSRFVTDHSISHPADLQLCETVRVDELEKLGHVAPPQLELAESRHVDQANPLAHHLVFG